MCLKKELAKYIILAVNLNPLSISKTMALILYGDGRSSIYITLILIQSRNCILDVVSFKLNL